MATRQLAPILHYLRRVTTPGTANEISDVELLSRFSRHRDEAAFTALVRRHGPMVLAVCQRVLRDVHTAEDAFQATFLVLARKAGSLTRPELLGHWLHGVAYRTAVKARTEAARRRTHEQRAAIPQETALDDDFIWRDLRAVLDEEVNRLPARYRVPVVLCYLQGQTNAEAARRLGCSRGTVATLLARARDKLRRRLTQRGVGLSVGAVLAALTQTAQGGAVSRALEQVTVKAATLLAAGQTQAVGALAAQAVALAKGVSKGMLMEKLKIPTAILMMTALVGTGAGVTAYCVRAQEGGVEKSEAEAKPRSADKTEGPRKRVSAPSEQLKDAKDEKATYRTPNFIVTAPTKEIAEQMGKRAEHDRKALAQLWLGQEMPTWGRPCPLRVTISSSSGGATEFAFDNGRILSMNMHIEGAPDQLIASVLPHEITHTVLAHYFRKPVPRWADEGAAVLSEDTASRANHDRAMAKVVRSGHLLPLRILLPKMDYPKDIMTFFAESYSLTDFLVSVGGRNKFLDFVAQGEKEGWEKAAKSIYHCESLEKLEQMWLGYVRMRRADERSDKPAREAPAAESRQSKARPAPLAKHSHSFQGKLPVGPAPLQMLAVLGEDGRLMVCRKVVCYQPVTTEIHSRNGAMGRVTSYTQAQYDLVTIYEIEAVDVYDSKGDEVEKKELRRRLKKETPILVSADARPVDPLHLRLYKDDTLVLVLPAAAPRAVQGAAPVLPPAPVVGSPPGTKAPPPAVPAAPQVAPPPAVAAPPEDSAPPGAVPPPPAVAPEENVPPSGS